MLGGSVCDLRTTMVELQERLNTVDGEGEITYCMTFIQLIALSE